MRPANALAGNWESGHFHIPRADLSGGGRELLIYSVSSATEKHWVDEGTL